MPTDGYSGTPLAKKLGITPGMRQLVPGAPPAYASWIAPAPEGLVLVKRATTPTAVHLFATKRADLERQLATLRRTLVETGFVWVSWPKQAAQDSR